MDKRKTPIGIPIFLLLLITIEIYWAYSFFTQGLFKHYDYSFTTLSDLYWTVIIFLFLMITIALLTIIYGFIKRKTWTRRFTILFLLVSSLFPIWSLILEEYLFEQSMLLIIYIIFILYLLTSYVKNYFKEPIVSATVEEVIIEDDGIYHYGKYTLYTREVELKGGRTVTIYFFSGKKPKSGKPCGLPEGYEVRINKRSNMPYLRKKKIKKKKNGSIKIKRRSSNVIYVVSKPQPGEVRGDWAVRGHRKIFSHHKTKEAAIKKAREIAKQKDATVMVQKTDGTFSKGFHPKKKTK